MNLDIDRIASSSASINLLATIARVIPRGAGYGLADLVAQRISSQRNSRLVHAVRTNKWVVCGEALKGERLDGLVLETLRQSARSIFDLYHHDHDLAAVGQMIVLEPSVQELLRRSEFEKRGILLAGIHLSNFDLVLRWFCLQGIRPLVLTVPEPRGGRRTEYEMRRELGMNLVPGTVAGLRHALRHLKRGGAVVTGIDRPIPRPRLQPPFFGRPAALPVHHVVLAARAGVPVVVICAIRERDAKYHIMASSAIEMTDADGQESTTLENAEKVLRAAEGFIRRAPEQWSVPLAVWPAALDLTP